MCHMGISLYLYLIIQRNHYHDKLLLIALIFTTWFDLRMCLCMQCTRVQLFTLRLKSLRITSVTPDISARPFSFMIGILRLPLSLISPYLRHSCQLTFAWQHARYWTANIRLYPVLLLTVCPPCPCWQAVYTRIALQRRYLASLGKLNPAEEDSLQRLISVQRAEVSLCSIKGPVLTYTYTKLVSYCCDRLLTD